MEGWAQVRIGAALLLVLYVGVAAALAPRELRFLSGVELKERRLFALQDILIQLGVLGVLLPCAIAAERSAPLFTTILAGMTLLWVSALWTVISRSMYTYKLMLGVRGEQANIREQLEQLEEQGRMLLKSQQHKSGESGDD